ncbi:MAG: TldD/PmbA family protein [Halobacteriovoraceae bacterium]|nr:TldD/PmbA family protein [Halobacteriovoraceae bacterium]
MNLQEISQTTLKNLTEAGAGKANVISGHTSFDELVYENDSFTLLRSVDEFSASLTAIVDQKKGGYTINQLSEENLKTAANKTLDIANAGKADDAFDICEGPKKMEFSHGPQEADKEAMMKMIQDFVARAGKEYPSIGLRTCTVKFTQGRTHFGNTSGVEAFAKKGYYTFSVLFNAQEGKNSSSMNYDGLDFTDFNIDLLSDERFGKTFKDTIAHLKAKKLGRNITGKAIFMPSCWQGFISFALNHLSNGSLISKTSRLQGKVGEKVASSYFHLESRPQDPIFANPNFLTSDGIETQNQTIFDRGVLKTYLLDLYGKNKLGEKDVSNFASRLYMPKGETSLEEMISGIDEGILVGRFSGGYPNTNGDFSGIAKNSFLIKDGKIDMALSETMISGNLFDVMEKIYATSSEVYENGTCHLPYVATENVTIS